MEPRIQYARTADGVSIAYYTLGEGMPLVAMPSPPLSHLELEWQNPEYRRWHEWLAEKRMVVRYDDRGSGLSDRDVTDFSLEAHLLDLDAVVERLGLDRFALFAPIHSGPVGIAYAARHPERVSYLILWCTYAQHSDYARVPQVQATRSLIDKDWETYTETVAHSRFGWSEGEAARQLAALMRECVTQQTAQAVYAAMNEFDVTALLPQVRSPALVLHRRQVPAPDVGVARTLASAMPEAQLALQEGTSLASYLGDTDSVLQAIDEFLGEGEEAAGGAAPPEAAHVHTILFTDVEGSTALTQRLGDASARQLLREHERMVREALKSHGGAEVKTMGDGFMASFASAARALECAIEMQRAFAAHN